MVVFQEPHWTPWPIIAFRSWNFNHISVSTYLYVYLYLSQSVASGKTFHLLNFPLKWGRYLTMNEDLVNIGDELAQAKHIYFHI